MNRIGIAILSLMALLPFASAHGALEINELETYAISDFEGQEDSFPWEGWDIWDVYVGDGYSMSNDAHGAYFKVNLAGSGELRPTGSQAWTVTFDYRIGNESFHRTVTHDGAAVTTDFEELEWEIADGNVFQVRAWAPVESWEGQTVADLFVRAFVDDSPRDVAPGGIHDPVLGTEIPVEAPPTPVFPALGEGRLVETVPLTGAEKFLDVSIEDLGEGEFALTIENPLSTQGQHVLFKSSGNENWTLGGNTSAISLDGASSATVNLDVAPNIASGTLEPLRFDIVTDVGGQQPFYAYMHGEEVRLTKDVNEAHASELGPATEETPAVGWIGTIFVLGLALIRRK